MKSKRLHSENSVTAIDAPPAVVRLRNVLAAQPQLAPSVEHAYVVGGVVRDAILGRGSSDIDIVIVGNAIAWARALAACTSGSVENVHTAFGTATVLLSDLRVDVATARSETYDTPGALPRVTAATIDDDLARRDFSVNAIAVALAGSTGDGQMSLIDPLAGVADLENRVLRVLHERSFSDDPTRLLRGARYASRLDLTPDAVTLQLIAAAVTGSALETVSARRFTTELKLLLCEPDFGAVLSVLTQWRLTNVAFGLSEQLGRDEASVLTEAFATLDAAAIAAGEPVGQVTWPERLALVTSLADETSFSRLLRRLDLTRAQRKRLLVARSFWQLIMRRNDVIARLSDLELYDQLEARRPHRELRHMIATLGERADAVQLREAAARVHSILHRMQGAMSGQRIVALGIPEGRRVGDVQRELMRRRLAGEFAEPADEAAALQQIVQRELQQ